MVWELGWLGGQPVGADLTGLGWHILTYCCLFLCFCVFYVFFDLGATIGSQVGSPWFAPSQKRQKTTKKKNTGKDKNKSKSAPGPAHPELGTGLAWRPPRMS